MFVFPSDLLLNIFVKNHWLLLLHFAYNKIVAKLLRSYAKYSIQTLRGLQNRDDNIHIGSAKNSLKSFKIKLT